MELKHQRRLEGLLASVRHQIARKRKNLTIHADELPALSEALHAAVHPGIEASMSPVREEASKARRVDNALRVLRDELRRSPDGTRTPGKIGEDLALANTLNRFVQDEADDTKTRLFDLIMGHDTKMEALKFLEN